MSQYPQVGSLIPSNNPVALANTLDNLLQDSHKLNSAKNDALKIFNQKLCWEHQAQVLLNQVREALKLKIH